MRFYFEDFGDFYQGLELNICSGLKSLPRSQTTIEFIGAFLQREIPFNSEFPYILTNYSFPGIVHKPMVYKSLKIRYGLTGTYVF